MSDKSISNRCITDHDERMWDHGYSRATEHAARLLRDEVSDGYHNPDVADFVRELADRIERMEYKNE